MNICKSWRCWWCRDFAFCAVFYCFYLFRFQFHRFWLPPVWLFLPSHDVLHLYVSSLVDETRVSLSLLPTLVHGVLTAGFAILRICVRWCGVSLGAVISAHLVPYRCVCKFGADVDSAGERTWQLLGSSAFDSCLLVIGCSNQTARDLNVRLSSTGGATRAAATSLRLTPQQQRGVAALAGHPSRSP